MLALRERKGHAMRRRQGIDRREALVGIGALAMSAVVGAAPVKSERRKMNDPSDRDSGPQAPLPWFLNACKANQLVALGEMHRLATEHDFIRQLISDPRFSADLVIEFGNGLYQDVLDAYIRGDSVSPKRLSEVWLNTTQSPIGPWSAPIYAELLAAVREANRGGRGLRVLAGDPPIDWSKVKSGKDLHPFLSTRDEFYISVVEKEVIARGRHGLLLIGGMHLLRTEPRGEGARFPSMPIVMPHGGSGTLNSEVEAIVKAWPVPSISRVAGTRLAGLTMAHLNSYVFDLEGKPKTFPPWRWEQLFDHYLYLGPASSLRWSESAPSGDPALDAELERRRKIVAEILPPLPPLPPRPGR
ncbi:MAG TPA: hypothetical protein VGL86_02615 [Polyangia bacterium]|jgi:hypothetical protein